MFAIVKRKPGLTTALVVIVLILCCLLFLAGIIWPTAFPSLAALILPILALALALSIIARFFFHLDRWLVGVCILIVPVIASFAILFWTKLTLPMEEQKHTIVTQTLTDQRRLLIDHANIITADGRALPLKMTLETPQPQSTPVTLTAEISPSLTLFAIHTSASVRTIAQGVYTLTLLFDPSTRVQTASLELTNPLTEVGSMAPWAALGTAHVIISTAPGITQTMDVHVESISRAALRSFVNSEIGERSPLILLTLALITAIGGAFSWREKQREETQKKQREQQERQQQREQQERQQQREQQERQQQREQQEQQHKEAHAQQRIIEIRKLLRSTQLEEAQEILHELEDQNLTRYVADDSEHVRGLLGVALDKRPNDDRPSTSLDALLQIWPSEAAGVLIYILHHLPADKAVSPQVRRAFRRFPQNRLSEQERRAIRAALDRRLEVYPPQARKWPTYMLGAPRRVLPDAPTLSALTLFDAAKAESEPRLFSENDSLFYRHPLYDLLLDDRSSAIVWGPAGVGRTALARRLSLYNNRSDTLGCYLSGMPSENDIVQALARRLLEFICLHPTLLRVLGEDQREFIASCCVSYLGVQFVLAQLERYTVDRRRNPPWAQEGTEDLRQQWEAEAEAQTAMFREDVVEDAKTLTSPNTQWQYVLCEAAHLLGFKQCRVAIDGFGLNWQKWATELFNQPMQRWLDAGLITTLIIKTSAPDVLENQPSFNCYELHWRNQGQDSPLVSMLQHRYDSLFDVRNSVIDIFENEQALSSLTELSENNPRNLATLWLKLQKQYPEQQAILQDMLKNLSDDIVY